MKLSHNEMGHILAGLNLLETAKGELWKAATASGSAALAESVSLELSAIRALGQRILGQRIAELGNQQADSPADNGEEFDKVAYMREFMHQKRTRMRRAAEIANMLRQADDALIGRARLEFMDAKAAEWKAELDKRIQAERDTHGRLPQARLDWVRSEFWQDIDKRLDEQHAEAFSKMVRSTA